MKNFVFILVVIALLSSCTGKQIVDSFRPEHLRGLTKCERQFKRALVRCPGLVDTTAHEADTSANLTPDSSYIDSLVGIAVDEIEKAYSHRFDSLRAAGEDCAEICASLSTDKGTQIDKEKQFFEPVRRNDIKNIKKKTIERAEAELPVPKILKDTTLFYFNGGYVKAWQVGNKLDMKINYKLTSFKNPCPEEHTTKHLLVGFFIGMGVTILMGMILSRFVFVK